MPSEAGNGVRQARAGMALTRSQQRVLELVGGNAGPATAYDLLRLLKDEGVTAPPVVYRALRALQERGLVHRIESLNAYVRCGDPDHHHSGQFAICRDCGRVEEITDPEVDRLIERWTGGIGFESDSRTIEVLGRCAACAAAASSRRAALT